MTRKSAQAVQWLLVIGVLALLYFAGETQMLVRRPLTFVFGLLILSFALVTVFWILFRGNEPEPSSVSSTSNGMKEGVPHDPDPNH